MIQVKNLTKIYFSYKKTGDFLKDLFFKEYKKIIALENISFEINNPEFVGLIGPNGAGKTTTMKILSGILYPTKGKINILGFTPFEKKKEFLRQISFVMGQKTQLHWDLPSIDSFYLLKDIYEINDLIFKKTLSQLTEILNCQELVNKPVKNLSLGERMKMELIASLLHNPRIIFLDEPTIGLDIFSQEAIRNFLKIYQKEFKATIILTSHYLEDVKKLAQRLIIINNGKIIYDNSLNKIKKEFSNKYLTIYLEKEIDKKFFEKIGEIIFYQYPKIIIKINKQTLAEKIDFINKNIAYSDLAIEEEKIEEIIKKILKNSFSKKTKS
ncbi:MAG: ATP-binding cassette domain-containing protein [Patescibacteria group bacterium]|nr:ATP-binding cassette domain-containing protein [Patescibacteria group bacterium]